MSYGTSTEPWSRRETRRHRQRRGRVLLAVVAMLSVAVIAVGTLVALRVISIPGLAAAVGVTPVQHHALPKPPPPPAKPQPGPIGSYQVASESYQFYDSARPQLGTRTLPVLVRYPVVPAAAVAARKIAKGPFPLVVFAPGWLQCADSYGALLHDWSSAGYVVAVVAFPRTACGSASANESDIVNQPGDVSAVITRLLALSAKLSGHLAGMIDPGKIAVAGHSDGGDVTAAIAANNCCRDSRITAAIVLAGAEWAPYGGSYFPAGTPPILFVQGDADNVNPPAASTQLYTADTAATAFYLDLLGYGHFAPYEGQSQPEPVVAKVSVDFLNRYLAGQASAASTASADGALTTDGNVPGVSTLSTGGQPPG